MAMEQLRLLAQRPVRTGGTTMNKATTSAVCTTEVGQATTNPRIYVACLAAYNSGYLHGAWIDADQPADDIQSAVGEMLAASPIPRAEEWAIHGAAQ